MGQRGPKPKPAGWYRAQGRALPSHVARDFPDPKPSLPECPVRLTGQAKACWDRVAPQLVDLGVLAEIDGSALARYCRLWSRWVDAENRIDEVGVYVDGGDDDREYVNPAVNVAATLADKLLKLEEQFGMTPSSRTRISANRPKEIARKSKFFNGPRPGPGMNDGDNNGGEFAGRPDDSAADAG